MIDSWKPSPEQIRSAHGKIVPDLIKPHLMILFAGINPSLYSAAVGHHFARPGNRFWPALQAAGLTPRLFSPFEDHLLLDLGHGVTNVVERSTATAGELSQQEIVEGGRRLEAKIRLHQPTVVAFLGITAYRAAFGRPRASIGAQPERMSNATIWVLPNPSGLNAHYRLHDLAKLYGELREAVDMRRKPSQSPEEGEEESLSPT